MFHISYHTININIDIHDTNIFRIIYVDNYDILYTPNQSAHELLSFLIVFCEKHIVCNIIFRNNFYY